MAVNASDDTHDSDFNCPDCDVPTYRFGDWGSADPFLECPACGERFDPENGM